MLLVLWRLWTIMDSSSPPAGPTVIAWSLDPPLPPRACDVYAPKEANRASAVLKQTTAFTDPVPDAIRVHTVEYCTVRNRNLKWLTALSKVGLMPVRAAVALYSMCQGNCDSESIAQPPGRNYSSRMVKHATKCRTSLPDSIYIARKVSSMRQVMNMQL